MGLPCGHMLHAECLRRCARSTCPICRAPLDLGPDDPLRVEPDTHFHKAIRWPNIIAAMRKQHILTGENDAENMLLWFGATEGGEVTHRMLKERLKDATPMEDVDFMMWMLIDDGDHDGDRKLNLRDMILTLENP